MIECLLSEHGNETWIVATVGTHTAAGIILDTGEAVMAMGGFSGGDPTPTGDELEQYLDTGELRFVLLSGGNQRHNPNWTSVVDARCDAVVGFGSLYDCGG